MLCCGRSDSVCSTSSAWLTGGDVCGSNTKSEGDTASTRHWPNAGPASETLEQRWASAAVWQACIYRRKHHLQPASHVHGPGTVPTRIIYSPDVDEKELATECFSHRLHPLENVGHFFGRSYIRFGLVWSVCVRISNITATFHLICRDVVKKLWTFFGPWGSISPPVSAMLKNVFFSSKTNAAIHSHNYQWLRCGLVHS